MAYVRAGFGAVPPSGAVPPAVPMRRRPVPPAVRRPLPPSRPAAAVPGAAALARAADSMRRTAALAATNGRRQLVTVTRQVPGSQLPAIASTNTAPQIPPGYVRLDTTRLTDRELAAYGFDPGYIRALEREAAALGLGFSLLAPFKAIGKAVVGGVKTVAKVAGKVVGTALPIAASLVPGLPGAALRIGRGLFARAPKALKQVAERLAPLVPTVVQQLTPPRIPGGTQQFAPAPPPAAAAGLPGWALPLGAGLLALVLLKR